MTIKAGLWLTVGEGKGPGATGAGTLCNQKKGIILPKVPVSDARPTQSSAYTTEGNTLVVLQATRLNFLIEMRWKATLEASRVICE